MKVFALTKYGQAAASTRQRVLQYIPHFATAGIFVDYHPLLGSNYVASLSDDSHYSGIRIARQYLKRISELLFRSDYDALWIYAELFPYLPAWFEQLAARKNVPIIYDMDDAFFHQYDDNPRWLFRKILGGKLEPLMRNAAVCCCGNSYLADYARRFCPQTMVLPTVVDTAAYRPSEDRRDDRRLLTIGWIGSPSTWRYMAKLLPMLEELCHEHDVVVHAVGAGQAAKESAFEGLRLIEWREENEISDVQAMDIGIMPLPDEPWARGKCGYKLIQYMACGLPVVASPVGVNSDIVTHGEQGYLATSMDEWKEALVRLIQDPALRRRMGEAGRQRVEQSYSLASQAPRLIEAFHSLKTHPNNNGSGQGATAP